jgi:Mrp family chromosome partitioning ATPase
MENIRQAVERRKALDASLEPQVPPRAAVAPESAPVARPQIARERLNPAYLESKRVIAHDVTDPRSRSFDILRTQVLQDLDRKSSKFLAVTSATPNCGKTFTSVNLALSIARQPDRSVFLIDLDLQKPNVAPTLGLRPERGLLALLAGECSLAEAIIEASIGNSKMLVLPTEAATQSSSEKLNSRPMVQLMNQIRQEYSTSIVIFDLPPILPSDDVISILPSIDSALFVTAIGTTTHSEIKECRKHLDLTDVLRVVVNKSEETTASYYY